MTTYYVDSTCGNDGHPGNSDLWPWRTSEKVKGWAFWPEDLILFKRGGEYTPMVVPSAGEAGSYIIFDAYGHGPKPLFRSTVDHTIYSEQPFVKFRNLAVVAPGGFDKAGFGIMTDAEDNEIRDCKITGVPTEFMNLGILARPSRIDILTNDISQVCSGMQLRPSHVGVPLSASIYRNTIHTLDTGDMEYGDGIGINGVNIPDLTGVVVSHNDISGFQEDGIDHWQCCGVVTEHNYIHDPTPGHVAVCGIRSKGVGTQGNIFRYNRIIDLINEAGKSYGISPRVGHYEIRGNYIRNTVTRCISLYDQATADIYENALLDADYGIFYLNSRMKQWDNVFRTTKKDICPPLR